MRRFGAAEVNGSDPEELIQVLAEFGVGAVASCGCHHLAEEPDALRARRDLPPADSIPAGPQRGGIVEIAQDPTHGAEVGWVSGINETTRLTLACADHLLSKVLGSLVMRHAERQARLRRAVGGVDGPRRAGPDARRRR